MIFTKQNSKHFDRSLFFGSSSFCLFFQKMFLIWTLLNITSGYFYPLVFAMGCKLKKIPNTIHTKKEKKRQSSFLQRHFKLFQFAQLEVLDWKVWFIEKICAKEKGKNLSSTSRRRWIQYVTLKPTCPVYWIVFFARTVWIISWRTIIIIKNQKCQKWGTLNFIRVVMHFMKTFQLGKCCRVSLTSCQTLMRIYMFAMKKGITVSLCLRGEISMMKRDVKDSIYILRLFCFQIKNGVFFVKTRDEIRKRMSGFVIIHPMVSKNQIYRKFNGHTVLTHCWRIRTANGLCSFVPQSSDLCVFVED